MLELFLALYNPVIVTPMPAMKGPGPVEPLDTDQLPQEPPKDPGGRSGS